jgi:hypothetical protein
MKMVWPQQRKTCCQIDIYPRTAAARTKTQQVNILQLHFLNERINQL